ncbi:hypothetical protein AB205_0139880 [Aquarana catesbeiana]|uniref:Uncharacterized protein n=1 Tax=Aquarana catesbeiana TaxID=8400 RepID=A0A2G9RBP7_AQUCT|nr:hypothetical protein AB205_0139880 [Aquarana catesbeiana]
MAALLLIYRLKSRDLWRKGQRVPAEEMQELSFTKILLPLLIGLPREHPESYHSFMWNNFFKHTDIVAENAHILDGNAPDLQAECDLFEEKIKAAGGIELFVGGQCAFNEPGSSLVSRTRVNTLAMDTILANARFFDGNLSNVPTMALTVGVGTVMDAKEINNSSLTFTGLMHVHNKLVDPLYSMKKKGTEEDHTPKKTYSD